MLDRIHHVLLVMPPGGEDAVRRYYGDILGTEELEKPPVLAARGCAWFRSGSLELHLGVEEHFQPQREAHPGIVVTQIEGLAARLEGAGAKVEWDEGFPGFRRFYADDPLGNRLDFFGADSVAGYRAGPLPEDGHRTLR